MCAPVTGVGRVCCVRALAGAHIRVILGVFSIVFSSERGVLVWLGLSSQVENRMRIEMVMQELAASDDDTD